MAELERQFPLFPLELVVLPSELMPLHIFEDRYQTMINHCIEQKVEFGIVWLSKDGLKDTGCACEICEILERNDDGSVDILVRGTRPLRVAERCGDLAYPAGDVEFLDDRDEAADVVLLEMARGAYAELIEQVTEQQVAQSVLDGLDAYEMAATVDFGLDAKQGLLTLRSENARLRLLTRLFRTGLKRLEFVDRAQLRARSNGKIRLG